MTKMHGIQEAEDRERGRRRGGPPLIMAVLVAVVSMVLAGPALAAEPPTVTKVEPKTGPAVGGTPVTITGTGFSGASAVKFGSTAATSFTVNSETSITAVSPLGVPGYPTGRVTVTVTTPAGTSREGAVGTDEFAYDPIITGIEPNTGPTGGGTLVTIHGEGFAEPPQPPPPLAPHGPDCVVFGSSPCAATVEVLSNTLMRAVAPAGTGTVDVRVTNLEGGTSLTSPADLFGYGAPPPPFPTVAKVEPNHGPAAGGTTVTITGTNLAETEIVEFGGQAALSFTVNSATSVTALSPAGIPGETVDVTVNTPNGPSATGPADRFTFESPPRPTVTNVEPGHGPDAGGTSVTITGTNFTGVSAVKFGSVNATSFKVESEGRISAVAPAGTGTVEVTVTTTGGTSPASTGDQYAYEPPTIRAEFKNWVLSGGLTLKKVNQPVSLPAGATFNGSAALSPQTLSGPLTGTVAIPQFNAVVKILGVPATVGLEFGEVGSVVGSLEQSKTLPGDLSLSVPTKENINFSTIGILGLTIATKCQTTEPLSLPLLAELSASELLTTGAHFIGTTRIPSVKCEGSQATLESTVLTALFSGPSNPYSLTIAPPT